MTTLKIKTTNNNVLVDLSKKIKINDSYSISLGRFLISLFVVFFQLLGMLVLNGWVLTPDMFFLLSTFVLSIGKDDKIKEE